nr:choline/carnitine O-acyltransferase [Corynebacterium aquatimens]
MPVPELDSTLDAYSHALTAVLSGEKLESAQKIVEDFRSGQGPQLDAKLRERAAEREAEGTNWLHDEWYAGYLTVREPLPLSTNVGFQLALDPSSETTGVDRVVEFTQRAAAIHLQAAGKTLPEDVDGRGNRITDNQWFVYAGSIRHPEADGDSIVKNESGAANREIGVFFNGRLFAVPISDAEGNAVSAHAIKAAFEAIRAKDKKEKTSPVDFNAPSLLGSGVLADLLPQILEQDGNADVYSRLSDFLFTIELLDDEGVSATKRIRKATFSPRGAWVYKPLSYQASLHDKWIAVHVEHSCMDGATLVTSVQRLQNVELPAADDSEAATEQAAPEELTWTLTEDLVSVIRKKLASFQSKAESFDTQIITVPNEQPAEMPFKVSRDASAQLIMSIAQQMTFGRVRAVYEAVDMREFRAGRTECLRAATPEAVTFARKLVDGEATQDDLEAAVNAHRGWVKRCKSGNGFDRHIQMLETIASAEIDAANPSSGTTEGSDSSAAGATGSDHSAELHPFFTDRNATAARRDFLSTTSIGGAQQVVRYCFAQTIPAGFGISYTPLPEDGEYCVSWNKDTTENSVEFRENLSAASKKFWAFVAQM